MTMATVTSTHRSILSSASLTAPPTQNTAPVHEFRCLYTRDLHKKSKKWHDGSVRFHTFNRRVMVYDDARNFIGDLHYGQDEGFGEGVEIRLDRGVLVEVGERLGETQTDLTGIIDRQRPEKGPSPRRQPISIATRLPSTGPSQRPKSLLEVLGTPQGRLGRGRIPFQSPYEQRHSVARLGLDVPSQKRQRLSSNKKDNPDQLRRSDRHIGPSLPQLMQPSKPVPRQPIREEPPIEFEEVHDLSSDEEPQRWPLQPPRLTANSDRIRKEALEKLPLSSTSKHAKPGILPRSAIPEARTGKDKNKNTLTKQQPTPELRDSATRTPSTAFRSSASGTARLLLSRPKHRQKLKCMLPVDTCKARCSETSSRQSRCRKGLIKSIHLHEVRPFRSSSEALRTENQVHGQRSPNSSPQSRTGAHTSVARPNSSPLFVPEAHHHVQPQPPEPTISQDEYPVSDLEDSDVFDNLDAVRNSQRPVIMQEPHNSPSEETDLEECLETAKNSVTDTQIEPAKMMDERQQNQGGPSTLPEAFEPAELINQIESEPLGEKADQTVAERNSEQSSPIPPGRMVNAQKATEFREDSGSERRARSQNPVEPEEGVEQEHLAETERQAEPERPTGMIREKRTFPRVEEGETDKTHLPADFESLLPPHILRHAEDGLSPCGSYGEVHAATANKPSPVIGQLAGSIGRPFRRVFSENDALEEEDATLVAKLVLSNPRSPLSVLENLSTCRSSAKFKSPGKIQRSVSDTVALDVESLRVSKPTEAGSKGATGPWTLDEAFLLFDWWPAELEKPACWAEFTTEPVPRTIAQPAQVFRGGITTARQFLRDDGNVL